MAIFGHVGQSKFESFDHQSNSKYKLTEVKTKFKFDYTRDVLSLRLTSRFRFMSRLFGTLESLTVKMRRENGQMLISDFNENNDQYDQKLTVTSPSSNNGVSLTIN